MKNNFKYSYDIVNVSGESYRLKQKREAGSLLIYVNIYILLRIQDSESRLLF